jgi:surface protein
MTLLYCFKNLQQESQPMNTNKLVATAFLLAVLSLVLSACQGESYIESESLTLSGVFLDGPVKGLRYSTPSQQGETDQGGTFLYKDGETVTFKIGSMELGKTNGKPNVTPLDLVEGTNATQNLKVSNIVRLLQSLDEDGNPSNGIQIPELAHLQAVALNTPFQGLDQFSLMSDEAFSQWLASIGVAELLSHDAARAHFEATLNEFGIPFDPTPAYALCENISCPSGEVCYAGGCFEQCTGTSTNDACYDDQSSEDVCDGVLCPQGEICYGGACFDPCTTENPTQCLNADDPCESVLCPDSYICSLGACVQDPTDPCTGIQCPAGEVCYDGGCFTQCLDPNDTTCYQDPGPVDPCDGVQCPAGEVCYDGGCFDPDPCSGITCPSGQICDSGICKSLNVPPVADAGADVTMLEGDLVSLSGANSFDSNGIIVSYAWSESGNLQSSEVTLDLSTYPAGSYVFTITVSDDAGALDSDSVNVVIEPKRKFIFTVNYLSLDSVEGSSFVFTIPTFGDGYNYNVDCDNDEINEATGVAGDYTCSYPGSGPYQVAIEGDFPQIRFGYRSDCEVTSIDQWGTQRWRSMNAALMGCNLLTGMANDIPDLSNVTDMKEMFRNAYSFNADISNWDVSNVTTMEGMFWQANRFNQPISGWDVSNVTNMVNMFYSANDFNQDIGGWNVANVTDMGGMFTGAVAFNQDISGWDVSKVTSMDQMFNGASTFNQNISEWDVSNVTNMRYMFWNATSFDQNLGSWNVGNVTIMTYMFNGVTLSNANYDALLIGWFANGVQNNVTFDGGKSQYTAGSAADVARTGLITQYGWTITDGGPL